MFFLLSGGTCSCLTASGLLFPSPPTPSCPEALTVCIVSTDTTLRFQEIPQYTPETDTRARWKFNSPIPSKKSSKASSELPKCPEQVSQLPAPNTNGYCQSYLSRNQVSGNENTTGSSTCKSPLPPSPHFSLGSNRNNSSTTAHTGIRAALGSAGLENSCLSVPVRLSSSDAHPGELFQLSGS